MLVRLLSNTDKSYLIKCAELMAISDDVLLWDGKIRSEITSNTDISRISLKRDGLESALISELRNEGINIADHIFPLNESSLMNAVVSLSGATTLFEKNYDGTSKVITSIEEMLIQKLKNYSLDEVESPAARAHAAKSVFKDINEQCSIEDCSVKKVVLFELMLVALRDGSISDIELALLKEFQSFHQLEDFIYDDLMEQAETMNREVNKTISIILE